MSLKRFPACAALLLGSSFAVFNPVGIVAALAQDAPSALQFGAPQKPAASFLMGAKTAAPTTAAPQAPGLTSWVLERRKPQDAADPSQPDKPAAGPDLSALRYYAQQNDLARVAAEIRLLRAKFPGWEPPADLFAEVAKPGESEQPLWDLFAKHDFEGLRAAMEARRQQTPDWQPSVDLSTKLVLAEAYDALVKASDAKDYGTVMDIAAANSGLMTCGNVDAIWRTAEALIQTDDEAHAVDAYRYILATCTKPQERLATVQKANLLVKSPEAMNDLMRMGKRLPNGTNEFAQIWLDGARQRIGEAAAGKTSVQPSPSDLDRIAAKAHAPEGRQDAELLGWYALSKKDFPGAESWFRTALQPGPSAKAAEGLVLALRDGGKMPEAVALAPQYAALGAPNRKLMMEVLVANLAEAKDPPSTEQLASLGAEIDAEKSADAAQSLGWSRYKAKDVAGAETWFRKSLSWQPSEAAAVGLMVAARGLKHQADYASVVGTYKATYPRVAELDKAMATVDRPAHRVRQAGRGGKGGNDGGWDQGATAIVQTFESGQVDQALAMMDARKAHRAEPKGLSVVRGWALYKKGDWDGAKQVFNDVGQRGMGDEAKKGLREIELGYTNPRYR